MAENDKEFAGSVPEIYDALLVPLIFARYADDMARRVAAFDPGSVLETAAGTGAMTRALASRLRRDAAYVATDLNQPMLERAARRQPADGRLEWRQADAMRLPFEDESFDVVCCQFGAMFFPDKVAAFGEAYRALRDGGRFVFSVWDRIGENQFADCVTRTAAAIFPDDPPVFLARTPHGYHETERIEADVRAAGFARVDIVTAPGESRAEDARTPAVAYCQGTPLRGELEARGPGRLDQITARVAEGIERRFGRGPVTGRIQSHLIIATR